MIANVKKRNHAVIFAKSSANKFDFENRSACVFESMKFFCRVPPFN